jgi:thioredoxin-like negative regulator of GroEL
MKPAWDKLSEEYKDSSVVVADVDCTVETDLCSTHGVSGYPTIKYFKDGAKEGESYSGGRDFDALKKFTSDTLEVKCDVNDQEGCIEKEVKYITKAQEKGQEFIQKQLARLQGMLSDGKRMKATLKQWIVQRLNILKQLAEEPKGKEEL